VCFAEQDPSVQQATRPSGKTQGLSDFNPFAAEQQQFVGQNYGSQVLYVEIDLSNLNYLLIALALLNWLYLKIAFYLLFHVQNVHIMSGWSV